MKTIPEPASPATTNCRDCGCPLITAVETGLCANCEGGIKQQVADALNRMRGQHAEHRLAARNGLEALPRLVEVMKGRSGQPYKLRKLLYSLWTGTPSADLSDIVCLDWRIRVDLCRVLLGWGFEDATTKFFYSALEAELRKAGLMEWFREEGVS